MSYSQGRGPPNIEGMYSLKVDNLTYRTSPDTLRRSFEKYGEVGDIYIPRDRYTKESRGFAFVRFYDKRDAEDAMDSMDGKMLDGRELRVQMASQKPTLSRYGRPSEQQHRRYGGPPPQRYGGYGRDGYRGGGGGRYGRRSRSPRRRSYSRSRSRDRGERKRSRSRSYSRSRSRSRDRSHSPDRKNDRARSKSPSRSRSRSRSPEQD